MYIHIFTSWWISISFRASWTCHHVQTLQLSFWRRTNEGAYECLWLLWRIKFCGNSLGWASYKLSFNTVLGSLLKRCALLPLHSRSPSCKEPPCMRETPRQDATSVMRKNADGEEIWLCSAGEGCLGKSIQEAHCSYHARALNQCPSTCRGERPIPLKANM